MFLIGLCPMATHPPSSNVWKAVEDRREGTLGHRLLRVRHAVEPVREIRNRGIHLLPGDPLGKEVDRHLDVGNMQNFHETTGDARGESLPTAQLMPNFNGGALTPRHTRIRERVGGYDDRIVKRPA